MTSSTRFGNGGANAGRLSSDTASSEFGAEKSLAQAADSVRDAAHDAVDGVKDVAAKSYEAASAGATRAYRSGEHGYQAVADFVRANPLLAIGGAVAAGMTIALIVGGKRRTPTQRLMRDVTRAGSEVDRALRRELRAAVNDARIQRMVNSLPTQEALSPWFTQIGEALSYLTDKTRATVADAAGKLHKGR